MLKSQNKEWGFFGTIDGDKETAWLVAFEAVRKATGLSDEHILAFMDGRPGRHFADQANCEGLEQTVKTWMNWKAHRSVVRQHRLSPHTPYLTAECIACYKESQA